MPECEAENHSWLHGRWLALVQPLSIAVTAVDETWKALVQHYSESHRAYHNLFHVAALLRLADAEQAHIKRREIVELAIWFHDVIYDTHAKDNEHRSAAWAAEAMHAMCMDTGLIASVTQCILATEKHEVPSSHIADLPLFLDLDLAVLGAPENTYRRYSQAIRIEYDWVPEPEYRAGRAEMLRKFLVRPNLFFTPAMAERFERGARHNIKLELQELARSI